MSVYGAGQQGQIVRVTEELAKVLTKADIVFTTRKEQLAATKLIDEKIKVANQLGADDTVTALKQTKADILELVARPDAVDGAAILVEAEEIHPTLADFVRKYTEVRGGPVVGPEAFKTIAKIMSEKMAEQAPVTQVYIDWLKRLGQTYALKTKKTRLPWITFDGKKLWQDYRPKVQQEIRFFDPKSKRYIRNVYQMDTPDGKVYGKADIGDSRRGYGVNGNHALDASLLRIWYLKGRKIGLGQSSIHDAIFLNINDLDKAVDLMRETYAQARSFPNLQASLKALLDAGLPKEDYDRFYAEGKALGFFSDGFSAEDVLASKNPPPGYDWYGFGQ